MVDEENETKIRDMVARFDRRIRELGIPELLKHADALRTLTRAAELYSGRVPIPFYASVADWSKQGQVYQEEQVWLPCAPTHVVCSHFTAQHFALYPLEIGRSLASMSSTPMPMALFDIREVSRDPPRLAEIMRFKTSRLEPGIKLTLRANYTGPFVNGRPHMDEPLEPFVAFVWVDCDL